ncbi:MAG: hypothetical protein ACKOTZ_02615 [Chloroflexota bacterium]
MRRPTLLATAALAAALVFPAAAPVAAADDPESAVRAFIDTIVAKDFGSFADVVCADSLDAVAEEFDLTGQMEGTGIDPQDFVDAVTFSAADLATAIVTSDAESALVSVSGTLAMSVDPDAFLALMNDYITSLGMDPEDPAVAEAMAAAMGELEMSRPIATEVEVVLEDGTWQVCGDLSGITSDDEGDEPDPSMVPDDGIVGGLCLLVTPEEIGALGPEVTIADDGGTEDSCTYSSDPAAGTFTSVTAYFQSGAIGDLLPFFTDAEEIEIAGRPALHVPSVFGLFIQEGEDRILVVQSFVMDPEVDALAYLTSVAELFLARIG